MIDAKKPVSREKRIVESVKRQRVYRRIVPPIIGVIVAILVIVYVISLLFNKYGSFTIMLKDTGDRSYSLSLCEYSDFRNPTTRLNSDAAINITNISGNSLPTNLNDIDGSHNGENYLAYTFYLKNSGELTCSYRYSLIISRATIGIDAAARVRVYYTPDYYKAETKATNYGDGSYVDYAKPKTNANGAPEIDPDNRVMVNFLDGKTVVSKDIDNFAPGDIAKITVVVWLEGDDPDCTDDILGGQFKLDMIMEVIGGYEGE